MTSFPRAGSNPAGRLASPPPGRALLGALRAGALLVAAVFVLNWTVGGLPSKAQGTREGAEEKAPDYPELFRAVAQVLRYAYLDLDRLNPKVLMEKGFMALENAVDEVYVEQTEALRPYLAVHVGARSQVFNLDEVDGLDDAVRMLENVFLFLKKNYTGERDLNEIRYATLNGFLSGLDPHTMVFSPDAFKDFSVHIEGEIFGVGMYVGSRDGKLMVIEVLKETPAAKAGFKKGDLIVKIGDESTINMTVPEAVDKIRGPLKSKVVLTVRRPKADAPKELESLDISVERDRVVIKSVESKLIRDWNPDGATRWKGSVGYAKVVNFDKNTTPSLKEHLDRLQAQNDGKPLAGLVLDLRNNSGGLLGQAVEMSDLFLRSGVIVVTASRNDRFQFTEARNQGNEPDYPIVVLANEQSASGAEIVIGALQKNDRAIVLGTRTFGKGSVQQLHRLPNEAQLKLTVSEYLLPGKISIQENGVVPNVHAKEVVLGEFDFDLFPNERSMTEKDYAQHIVSRFAKKESPAYTIDYYFDPPKYDPYSDTFMSGEIEPEKEALVQMALDLMKLSGNDFRPGKILAEGGVEIGRLKARHFDEIVAKLKEKGIDWTFDEKASLEVDPAKIALELEARFDVEPSEDEEEPLDVNKLAITARLSNRGDLPIFRMKGLSRSDFFLYKDQEFLFGRVDPGQSVERKLKIRLPYYPTARNDVFGVELSSMNAQPGWEVPEKSVLSREIAVELVDRGRPSFAYSAELVDAATKQPIRSLSVGTDALLKVKIRNTGTTGVFKGIAILKTEDFRRVFLKKGRIPFLEDEEAAPAPKPAPTTISVEPQRSEGGAGEERVHKQPVGLEPNAETEVVFSFEVRDGEPVEEYKFEFALADSYSNVTLVRTLKIPRRDREESMPFPNGVRFATPEIAARLIDPDSKQAVLVTKRDSLLLEALIRTPDGDPFKAWVLTSVLGDREYPDKIFFVDSEGDPKIQIRRSVSLKAGSNLFTVVATDRDGLESRQNLVVRRE